ncbi:MAG: TetR/AcrR family transcriptional regulator, partial [Bacteroidota bacterium]
MQKKEKILDVALELFSTEGYNAISTSKIARQAGVSEGLIFRHFKNKKGLLDALVKEAERQLGTYFYPILVCYSPKKVLNMAISLPFMDLTVADYHFWKLQFKLKWTVDYNHLEKSKPLTDKILWAFQTLNHPKAEQEAQLFMQIIDSLCISVLRDGVKLT